MVKTEYFVFFIDWNRVKQSWAKSVIVSYRSVKATLAYEHFFPLIFLLFEQTISFFEHLSVEYAKKKSFKQTWSRKAAEKTLCCATTRLLCISSLRQRFTVTWSWKMHESNRGPFVSNRFLWMHILLSQRRGLCRGLKITSGWKRRSKYKPLGQIHS